MSYCQPGDKPIIKYQFSGQNEKVFKSQFAPITIQTGQAKGNIYGEDYNPEGFTIVYVNGIRQTVINYRINPANAGLIQFWTCGRSDWDNRQPDGTYSVWYNNPGISSIDYSAKCPAPYPSQNCFIRITHQNIVLHLDRGACPVTFTVNCGNCPDGQEEHKTSIYPGYCCLDCRAIANEIRGITNIVRGVNRG